MGIKREINWRKVCSLIILFFFSSLHSFEISYFVKNRYIYTKYKRFLYNKNLFFSFYDHRILCYEKKREKKIFISYPFFYGKSLWKKYKRFRPNYPHFRWYYPLDPDNEFVVNYKLSHLKKLLRKIDNCIDGIFLDFFRYPVFWEIDRIPFVDKVSKKAFSLKLKRLLHILKKIKYIVGRDKRLGVFVVPKRRDYNIPFFTGQDDIAFSKYVSFISPMLFYQLMNKRISFVKKYLFYKKILDRYIPIVLFYRNRDQVLENVLLKKGINKLIYFIVK